MRSFWIAFLLETCIWKLVFSADPKAVLTYTYPFTTKEGGQKVVVVEKDQDVFLMCKAGNKPGNKPFQWLVQMYDTGISIPISTNTDVQNAFKYSLDKPSGAQYRLKIHGAQPEDEGQYICRIQLSNFQYANDSRLLKVVQKPQVIDIYTSSDMVLEEGDRAQLSCQANGIPAPLITWQRAGSAALPHGGLELVAPSLTIDSVDRSHKGIYKCIAQNIAGTDERRIILDVKFKPHLVTKSQQVFQALGYDRELICQAAGNPAPTDDQLMWFKDGRPILDGDKYEKETYQGSNYVLMKLRVKRIDSNDYGQYSCYAENSQGNAGEVVALSRTDRYVSDRLTKNRGVQVQQTHFMLTIFIAMTTVTSLMT